MIGTGEVFDTSKVTPMDAGNFIFMPKTMRHFALCKGDTVLQVHGIRAVQDCLVESSRSGSNESGSG